MMSIKTIRFFPLIVLVLFAQSCSTPTQPTRVTSPTPTSIMPSPGDTDLPLDLTPTQEILGPTPSSNPLIASATPLPPPAKYFTNEWDENTKNWSWFSTKGDDNLWDVYNEAGVLVFSLLGEDTNAYFVYKPWVYEKIRISTQIEVRSPTKSSTVILCNYSEEIGWYEFIISTSGLWEVRAHDTLGKTGYLSLTSGGSLAIQTGEGINEYIATCNGNHVTLSINGSEVFNYTDNIMKYTRGKIGLGVLSYSEVPILIESAWVKVEQP